MNDDLQISLDIKAYFNEKIPGINKVCLNEHVMLPHLDFKFSNYYLIKLLSFNIYYAYYIIIK